LLHRTVLLLLGLAAVLSTSAPVSRAQALEPAEPLVVVQNFLAARDARDAVAAATWCAALLELQDVDGQWFIDEPATIVWLRLLMSNYTVEQQSPLVVQGNTVAWTERLTRTGATWAGTPSITTVEVHAVVRDERIVYLSGPYPPIPFRGFEGATGASTGQTLEGATDRAPITLFIASSVALSLAAVVAAKCGPLLCAMLYGTPRSIPTK
jgi:hypothetical protein